MRALSTLFTAILFASTAGAEVPKVVTDIPVTQSLVSLVLGDLGAPILLSDQGADPHDFQLRPSQIQALNDADLVVWIGSAMSPWLDSALTNAEDAQNMSLLDLPGTTIREGEADHGGIDPHAWLDPTNALLWIGAIANTLADQDPEHAAAYLANADQAKTRISALDAAIQAELDRAGDGGLVMAHDAYDYFADHYGLNVVASLAEGDAHDPGAAHLSDIRADLESGAVACIFPEAMRDPAPVEALADGLVVRVGAPLDPAGRSMMPGADLYAEMMQAMGDSIAKCLRGD